MEVGVECAGKVCTVVVKVDDTVADLTRRAGRALGVEGITLLLPSHGDNGPSPSSSSSPSASPHSHPLPLGEDETLISETPLCSGDTLTAVPVQTAAPEEVHTQHGGTFMSLSPCGELAVCGAPLLTHDVYTTNLTTGECSRAARGGIAAVHCTAQYIAYIVCGGSTVHLIDSTLFTEIRTLGCPCKATGVSATADGEHIVVCSADGLRIFNSSTGICVRRRFCLGYKVVVVPPRGKWVAALGTKGLDLLSFDALERRQSFFVKRPDCACLPAFSPCVALLACASRGGVVSVFDRSGTVLSPLTMATVQSGVTSLVFSGCSKYLFSSSYDGRLVRWDVRSRVCVTVLRLEETIYRAALRTRTTAVVLTRSGIAVRTLHFHGGGEEYTDMTVVHTPSTLEICTPSCACCCS